MPSYSLCSCQSSCHTALKDERCGMGVPSPILTAIITEDSCSIVNANRLIINVFASSRGAPRVNAMRKLAPLIWEGSQVIMRTVVLVRGLVVKSWREPLTTGEGEFDQVYSDLGYHADRSTGCFKTGQGTESVLMNNKPFARHEWLHAPSFGMRMLVILLKRC